MTAAQVRSLIPTMQSIALLSENIKEVKSKKKKPIKMALTNLVGLPLIQATAKFI